MSTFPKGEIRERSDNVLTVEEVKRQFVRCGDLSKDRNTERVIKEMAEVLPAAQKRELKTLEDYMARAVSLRRAEILLRRRTADDEFSFICPKDLLNEEKEKELQAGGWFTGHWFRDMSTGKILEEVSAR